MRNKTGKRLFEIAVVFFWASEYCHAPYFTPYLGSLGFSSTLIGLIVGSYGFTQMLVRIPLGIATDATSGYKAVTVGGLFFTTLSSFGLWLFTDVYLIFLFRIFAGVAASAWIAMTVAYMSYYREEDAVTATALLNSLNSCGKLLAFVLGALAARFFGYRAALFMSFLTGLIGLCLVPFTGKVELRRSPASLKHLFSCLKNKNTLIPALLAAVSMMIVHGTVFSFTSTLAEGVGAGALMLSVLSMAFTLIQILSTNFLRSNFIKNGRRSLQLCCGFLMMSGYLVILAFSSNAWMILCGQLVAGFAFALLNSLLMSECVRGVPPGEKTTAMGIYQAVYGIGMTIGPVYMGKIMDSLGVRPGCLLLAGFVALVALIVRFFLFRDSAPMIDKAA
ncbi:MAG: MFS transporter [Candidatus Heteroscillospira sp.]|jgi:predicted MFS family arabinose efflux permease